VQALRGVFGKSGSDYDEGAGQVVL